MIALFCMDSLGRWKYNPSESQGLDFRALWWSTVTTGRLLLLLMAEEPGCLCVLVYVHFSFSIFSAYLPVHKIEFIHRFMFEIIRAHSNNSLTSIYCCSLLWRAVSPLFLRLKAPSFSKILQGLRFCLDWKVSLSTFCQSFFLVCTTLLSVHVTWKESPVLEVLSLVHTQILGSHGVLHHQTQKCV